MVPLKTIPAHYITIGSDRLPLIAAKHPRARSIVVRYDASRDCVKVTMPRYVSLKRAVEFAQSREAWIGKQRDKMQRAAFIPNAIIPLLGKEVTLVHAGGRGLATREENRLLVPGDAEFMGRRVHEYIRKELLRELTQRCEHYAQALGVKVTSLRIQDMRSRWGSCSRSGAMSFAYRLAFAPYEVMDYVVCHEVAHLRHLDHSASFWKVVEQLCPAFEQHEAWLRVHGQSLWNYG